tara:strand:- start:2476 stop:4311 length:1836 start_codon:yes stop_codon:yes gene_type:complete
MATNIESTQLDFARIKEALKVHFLANDAFADYDFEASALDNILDVLAYNTHYNGLISNFALNEAFLNTAQLRSSVLAIAETLGYTPRSKTAASATVNLSLTITDSGRPVAITLPINQRFNTTIDDISYTFWTTEVYGATDDGTGVYRFQNSNSNVNIPIYEGSLKTKSFLVSSNSNPIYIIPDDKMDAMTAEVKVYRNRNSSLFDTYLPYSQALSVTATSTYYSLRESPNGFYELYFGDGTVLGKKPVPGEFIVVTYLATNAEVGNGAKVFSPQTALTIGIVNYTLSVNTVSRSAGGSNKESITSIKANAPIQFASQNRLVTATDYIALIGSNYGSYLKDVTAWGGEDNSPANYGKVYVSLNYKDGTSDQVKETIKSSIVTDLAGNRSIMSIDTVFEDAQVCYTETSTFFNFNPSLTSTTLSSIENQVNTLISNYFNNNLNQFNKIFRRSTLLAEIDDLSTAILNSRMDIKVQKRFTPVLSQSNPYRIVFPVELSTPLSTSRVITSNIFRYLGQNCIIRNRLSSNILEVVTVSDQLILVTNVGSYNALSGIVNIVGFAPTSILGSLTQIKISAIPANQSTVRPLRNFILSLDADNSFSSAQIDYERIKVNL